MRIGKHDIFVCVLSLFLVLSSHAFSQTVNTISSVDFGSFDFDTSYMGSIRLATNGNVTTTGSGISPNGGETAGHLRVVSPATGIIEIRCATTAVLADPTATSLTIENIEVAVNTGTTFGSGSACNGSGGADPVATTVDLDALPTPNIFIGGEIMFSGPITLPTDKTYSTSGSGTPIRVSIVVQ